MLQLMHLKNCCYIPYCFCIFFPPAYIHHVASFREILFKKKFVNARSSLFLATQSKRIDKKSAHLWFNFIPVAFRAMSLDNTTVTAALYAYYNKLMRLTPLLLPTADLWYPVSSRINSHGDAREIFKVTKET